MIVVIGDDAEDVIMMLLAIASSMMLLLVVMNGMMMKYRVITSQQKTSIIKNRKFDNIQNGYYHNMNTDCSSSLVLNTYLLKMKASEREETDEQIFFQTNF